MELSLCHGKYGIAALIVIGTYLVYSADDFESLKINLLVLVALKALVLLMIDYAMEDEICRLTRRLDLVDGGNTSSST